MLEVRNLSAGYSTKEVLKDININVYPGQVTALLGPNGCGKSTLLKAICGIVPIDGGDILIDGVSLKSLSPKEAARQVSYLTQNRPIPDTTVRRMVLHGRFPYLDYPRRYRKEDFAIADAAIEQMEMTEFADAPLGKLSGGQRQRVYIAMALAQNTQVMLLDEPTTYLDVAYQLQTMRQVKELGKQGKTVVMVIHDLSHALRIADRVILINNGCVVDQGSVDEVYANGKLNSVFGVKLDRIMAEDGWHYICRE